MAYSLAHPTMAESDRNLENMMHGAMDQLSAHLDRGWDLVGRGEFERARVSAEQGVELDPQSPEAHNLLGYVLASLGHAEEGLEQYQQALALDEGFVEAMLNAAEIMIHPLHDFEGASRMIHEVLDLAQSRDEVADALLLLFDARMHAGDERGAAEVARRLPRGPFETTRLDFLVGRALFEVGMHDEARSLLQGALERDPDSSDGQYYMGLLHELAGDASAAVQSFLRARALDLTEGELPGAATLTDFETVARAAVEGLPEGLRTLLAGALMIVSDVPGVELVADGVDPRAGLVLDGLSAPGEPPAVSRLFIYKRNLERVGNTLDELAQELADLLAAELEAAFPSQLQ